MPERFFPLVPGAVFDGDWYDGRVPMNIEVGESTVVDSAFSFKQFFGRGESALRIGNRVTFWRTSLAVEETGMLEIGDDCFFGDCSIVVHGKITIGSRCFVAGGVTIVDSDFHPVDPAQRIADSIANSPLGDRRNRPEVGHAPVHIGDDVWIGWHAAILKGVRIGDRAVIEPGSMVLEDVGTGQRIAGNPGRPVAGGMT